MKVYNRKTGEYDYEREYQDGALNMLYNTAHGRAMLKLLVAPPVSRMYARYQNSARSKKDILPFARRHGVDLEGYDPAQFESFNEFFTRQRENTTDAKEHELVAIADSRLSAFPITDDLTLKIKHSIYSLLDLVGRDVALEPFSGGTCLVFRLSVQDYHRYVFLDDGEVLRSGSIPGELHTVRPVSDRFRVYARNFRVWTLMQTKHFGPVLQIEVGALMVGKIRNRPIRRFSRLEEKGWFEFGGSTILLLLPKEIRIDEDILEQSRLGCETLVTIGEKIGEVQCSND